MVAQLQDVKELESAGFFPKDERPMEDAFRGDEMEGKDALGNTIARASVVGNIDERHVTQMTEFIWLMRREIIAMKRDKMFLAARFMQATFMSLLIGVIFLKVGDRDPDDGAVVVQSIFGGMVMALFMCVMGTALPTLLIFPQERPVFLREYSTNHYSVLAYFMSRFAIEAFITAVQVFVTAVLTYYMIGFKVSRSSRTLFTSHHLTRTLSLSLVWIRLALFGSLCHGNGVNCTRRIDWVGH
jgi:hypothetical protein